VSGEAAPRAAVAIGGNSVSYTDPTQEASLKRNEHRLASQTDLARLVERVSREQLSCVIVGTSAVIAWQRREPEAWTKVRAWLVERGVGVVEV
jgi:hypothetical protein